MIDLMKAMKEEGHPQGLPGLHERVIGKVVLWGDGLGWACGEPHEAELGEDWDTPPGGGLQEEAGWRLSEHERRSCVQVPVGMRYQHCDGGGMGRAAGGGAPPPPPWGSQKRGP